MFAQNLLVVRIAVNRNLHLVIQHQNPPTQERTRKAENRAGLTPNSIWSVRVCYGPVAPALTQFRISVASLIPSPERLCPSWSGFDHPAASAAPDSQGVVDTTNSSPDCSRQCSVTSHPSQLQS